MREITTRLRPLVQLLPAAAVAATVLVTLPGSAPQLAEVPERLEMPQPEPEAVSAPETPAEPEATEPETPLLPYADGVYTGSSRGYGGQVKVQVTMEGGKIANVEILDASHETSAFLKRAKRLTNTVLDAQTWEVDAVSEATYTSRGILGAIQNALTGEEVINPLPPKKAEPKPIVVEEFAPASLYRDGVYIASAEGYGGPIVLQVTISGGKIADIGVVSAEGESGSYFTRARRVISAILESGTPDVDSISGATYSSVGIRNAVQGALAQAANETAASSEPVEEAPAEAPAESAPAEEPAAEPEQPAASEATAEPTDPATAYWNEAKQKVKDKAKALWKKYVTDEPAASETAAETAGEGTDE